MGSRGCDGSQAWADLRGWRVLDTGLGSARGFLATWRAWLDDPKRPALLHYVGVTASPASPADILHSVADAPQLQPLADTLAQQWWGLVPGFHRLVLQGGRVLLTVCVGDLQAMLAEQSFRADSVVLGHDRLDLATLKAVSRLCRRGTRLASSESSERLRHDLSTCGFRVEPATHAAPLCATFDPAWEVKGLQEAPPVEPGRCVVIGAGIAGASVAASFARRGWQVEVLDAADAPAQGASALPAGLMAPRQSPDDNPASRLSRAGVRATLQQAHALLRRDVDWSPTGVLEVRVADDRPPPELGPHTPDWTSAATPARRQQASIAPRTQAWWHAAAAWLRPAALVDAWLREPGVRFRGGARVHALQRSPEAWRVLDAAGAELARAELVIVAAACASSELLGRRVTVHPIRGQVSWGDTPARGMPPFPLNGNGHLIPSARVAGHAVWLAGATFGRGDTATDARAGDHLANLARLRVLSPSAAKLLAPQFDGMKVRDWVGVRCASHDRRPLVGWLEEGLGVCTAMGSRGLTFAALAGETLAARLHGEPLPLERKLDAALDVARQRP